MGRKRAKGVDLRVVYLYDYRRRKDLQIQVQDVKNMLINFSLPITDEFMVLMFAFIQDLIDQPQLEESEKFRQCRHFVSESFHERLPLYDQLRDRASALAIHMPSFELGIFAPREGLSPRSLPAQLKTGNVVCLDDYRKLRAQKKKK